MFENNNNEKPSNWSLYKVYFIKLSLHMLLLRPQVHSTLEKNASNLVCGFKHDTRTLGFVCLCPVRVVWKKPESTFLFLFLREARIVFSNIHLEERRQHSSGSSLTIYFFFKKINILTVFFIFYKSCIKIFLK